MPTQKANVKNPAPASQLKLPGNVAKPNPSKSKGRPKGSGYGMARSGNQSAQRKGTQRKNYRRNTAASQTAGLFTAFLIALTINLFDAGVSRVLPSASSFWRTIGKFGVGWAAGQWGTKYALTRRIAPVLRDSLYIAGFLDVVATHAMPRILGLVDSLTAKYLPSASTAAAVAPAGSVPAGTTTSAAGQLGQVFMTPQGQRIAVYDNRQSIGYNPQSFVDNRELATVWR
jgi:hypothetical protein